MQDDGRWLLFEDFFPFNLGLELQDMCGYVYMVVVLLQHCCEFDSDVIQHFVTIDL